MKKHRGNVLDTVDGIKVIDCKPCGFIHVSPVPTEEELKKFYETEFYEHERPNYFKETREDLPWWMATYQSYYELFEKHTKGRTLLDIGSGPGHFLACGKKRGWEVVGIEPSGAAAHYSNKRGLKTIHDFFSYDRAEKLGTFDVVHAAMVLEHVPDPLGFIRDMKKMLRRGGLLAIFCPNDYNPLQQILRTKYGFKPWWVVPKHHLNYFTPQHMKSLFDAEGCTTVELIGTYPLETFLLAGKNYVGNHALGRECHRKRKAFELAQYARDPSQLTDLYRGLAQAGIGREYMIIAKKK